MEPGVPARGLLWSYAYLAGNTRGNQHALNTITADQLQCSPLLITISVKQQGHKDLLKKQTSNLTFTSTGISSCGCHQKGSISFLQNTSNKKHFKLQHKSIKVLPVTALICKLLVTLKWKSQLITPEHRHKKCMTAVDPGKNNPLLQNYRNRPF